MKIPFAHTYSIVARDPKTGQMGTAVQSHWFSVGSVVPWVQAGIGAIATQSLTEVSYGPLGLELLRGGKTAKQTLDALLIADEQREVRQVAIVDAGGNVAAHTGSRCIDFAGHIIGNGFSVQANMMLYDKVPAAMATAYQNSLFNESLDLADRLLLALEAAQSSGGDIRGQQSAAIKIVESGQTTKSWGGILMALNVEDHPDPLGELRRLVQIQRGYHHMSTGDDALAVGDTPAAMKAYQKAVEFAPQIVEIPFWNAVTLADTGKLDEALPIFREVFSKEPIWLELLKRLPKAGLIKEDNEMLKKIYAVSRPN